MLNVQKNNFLVLRGRLQQKKLILAKQQSKTESPKKQLDTKNHQGKKQNKNKKKTKKKQNLDFPKLKKTNILFYSSLFCFWSSSLWVFFSVCSGFIYLLLLLLLLVSLNYLLCAVGLLILVNILNNHKPCRQDLGSPSKPNHLARALTNQTWGTDPLLFGHNMSQTSDFWEEASI